MTTGLILTMGLSPEPLIFSIQQLQADYVVFIGTEESLKKSVDSTVEKTGLRPSQYNKIEIKDSPEEIGALCEKFEHARSWLKRQGADRIISDPTGGRKWMSAGAVMVASFLGVPMIYVDARYDKGIVIPETMHVVDLGNAYDQTGFIIAAKGRDAYTNFDFASAANYFNRITPTLAHKKELFQGLSNLCNQLARWDRFEHHESSVLLGFEESIQQIDRALRSVAGSSLFADFSDALKVFTKHIKEIEASPKLSIEFIVDIFLNASRCIRRNRFDDAVARHYRTLEAISQYFLNEKGINTESPDYSKLTSEQLAIFKLGLRGNNEENIQMPEKIDLKIGFWLLRSMNHQIKDFVFSTDKKSGDPLFKGFIFEGILNDRNNSILAHGFKPIGKDRAEKFHKNLEDLLERAFTQSFLEVKKKLELPPMPEIGF
jgi:CRISPR-associated protein (TIGR02710 family)